MEIEFGECSHKLIIKNMKVDKLPKRKAIKTKKARTKERYLAEFTVWWL